MVALTVGVKTIRNMTAIWINTRKRKMTVRKITREGEKEVGRGLDHIARKEDPILHLAPPVGHILKAQAIRATILTLAPGQDHALEITTKKENKLNLNLI